MDEECCGGWVSNEGMIGARKKLTDSFVIL